MSDELAEVPVDERPALSGLAVLAAILGLGSVLALSSRQMWFVPVVAMFLALIALRPRSAHSVRPRGLWLAGVGLSAAAFFGGIAVQRDWTRQDRTFAAAEPLGLQWLELFKHGAEEIACELAIPKPVRTVITTPLEEYYNQTDSGRQKMEKFLTQGVGKLILGAGSKPEWEILKRRQIATVGVEELVLIEYRDKTGTIETPILLGIARPAVSPDPAQDDWYISVQEFVRKK